MGKDFQGFWTFCTEYKPETHAPGLVRDQEVNFQVHQLVPRERKPWK